MLRSLFSILLPSLLVLLVLYYMLKDSYLDIHGENMVDVAGIPSDLEARVTSQFEDLLERGLVAYQPSDVELFEEDGFKWEFRQIEMLKKKPILEPTAPGRSHAAGGPFVDPAPEVVVMQVGDRHRLLINRYNIYPAMLILSTINFEPQTDDLNLDDLAAAWGVLTAFESPQIVIYNCGVNSGSSQGHKHLQIFAQPKTGDTRLWPSNATSTVQISDRLEAVPFQHFVLRIPTGAPAQHVYMRYQRLLSNTKRVLSEWEAGSDNNVIMTKDWIAVIPRRTAVWGGPLGANAAGMLGLVSIPDQEQRSDWARRGYTKYLTQLGVPLDKSDL